MTTFWLIASLLIVISVALLATPILRNRANGKNLSRDAMNKMIYQHRLSELRDDEARGVIAEPEVMLAELQQNLLQDIPSEKNENEATGRLTSGIALIIPGVIVLLAITVGTYYQTGGWRKVDEWQRVVAQLPELRTKLTKESSEPLSVEEIARLGLGVRTSLQQEPRNVADWMLLGRIGMVLQNMTTATQAYAHAYELAPDNLDVKLGYAEVLVNSSDAADNQLANRLLRQILEQEHGNLRALSLFAFNAFEQGNFQQAIGAWQMMLKVLPENDERRGVLQRSIRQAEVQLGVAENAGVTIKVALNSEVMSKLPPQGVLIATIYDGASPIPVAVKELPLSTFPVDILLDDSDVMMPGHSVSALKQIQVKVRISRNSQAKPESGDWYGESDIQPYSGNIQLAIKIDKQVP